MNAKLADDQPLPNGVTLSQSTGELTIPEGFTGTLQFEVIALTPDGTPVRFVANINPADPQGQQVAAAAQAR